MQKYLARFCAPTLAVTSADDPYATLEAVDRALSYSPRIRPYVWELRPEDLGVHEIGHFGLFHSRFRSSFWPATVDWLCHGTLPGNGREEPVPAGPWP